MEHANETTVAKPAVWRPPVPLSRRLTEIQERLREIGITPHDIAEETGVPLVYVERALSIRFARKTQYGHMLRVRIACIRHINKAWPHYDAEAPWREYDCGSWFFLFDKNWRRTVKPPAHGLTKTHKALKKYEISLRDIAKRCGIPQKDVDRALSLSLCHTTRFHIVEDVRNACECMLESVNIHINANPMWWEYDHKLYEGVR